MRAPIRAGLAAIVAGVGFATSAVAGPIPVLRYDMPNGDGNASGGTFNYWDRGYTGSGATTTDGAALAGGLGKLTDGVVSTQPWQLVSNTAGTGEYVGWYRLGTPDPILTFTLAAGFIVDRIDIALDNTAFGGVVAPSAILVDGVSRPFTAPAAFTVGIVSLAGLNLGGPEHTIQFIQDGNTWTFVSEISFADAAAGVPEPDAGALFALGAVALLIAGRRRRDAV